MPRRFSDGVPRGVVGQVRRIRIELREVYHDAAQGLEPTSGRRGGVGGGRPALCLRRPLKRVPAAVPVMWPATSHLASASSASVVGLSSPGLDLEFDFGSSDIVPVLICFGSPYVAG